MPFSFVTECAPGIRGCFEDLPSAIEEVVAAKDLNEVERAFSGLRDVIEAQHIW
ncbi:MAG: hypothetical protein LAP85_16265 [Acidobacteriia bacterium]|nr:hypothetical protein [Terriglobia bacterium]